jgi:hypothetical protein
MARTAAIAALLLTVSVGAAQAERWRQIGREETGATTGRVFWDDDSLTVQDGRIRLRSRVIFDQATVAKQYGGRVKSIRSDFDIYCPRLTGRHLVSEMYGTDGKIVFTLRGERGSTLVPWPIVIDVCEQAKRRAS